MFAIYQMLFDLTPFSLFLVFKKTRLSYFQTCASLSVQEDTNGCAGREKVDQRTGERLKYNDIQGVCHRPHRDGDILRDPSGEAHQDSLLGFSFPSPSSFFRQNGCVLCVQTAQHARPVSSLIGPVFLSHT